MQNLPPHLTSQSQSPMDMQSMQGGMLEGYDQIPDSEDEPQKILAHFAPDELHDLDEMQGGILIDPETNLREYTPLDKILRNPEIRQAISEGLSQSQHSQGVQNFAMGGEVEPGRPIDPELEKLRLEGRKGDTEIVIITPELLEIFTEWSGKEPDINPTTGLPEFGFFKTILRIAAPIVGAILGGPIGAAAFGGLATKLTGGSWGQALGSAALSGFGAVAAPMLGGMVQNSFPGFSAGLGSATRGIFGENVGGALGKLFTPSPGGGMMSSVGLNSVGKMLPGMGQAAAQGVGQAGMQAAGQTGGGILGALGGMGNILPLVGSGLLMAKGHKDEQKGLREYQQQLENRENRERQRQEGHREKYGFNAPLKPVRPFQWRPTNAQTTQDEKERGITKRNFDYDLVNPYAQGGAIRGNGKGQQDNIPKNIRENSYIIDASTVSDIGDGSSNAGMQELDRYFSRLPSNPMNSNNMGHESKGGYIQAMVSDGEYEISPEQVTALGKGSNEKGAQILKKFVEEVRSKKRTSGERLPPKSKPIGGYLKGIKSSYV
jgi:hypothetical protein